MTERWQEVDERLARVQLERFAATVDLWNPAGGLREVTVDGRAVSDFHPLCVELPLAANAASSGSEHYVRSGDLVATYANLPAPDMRSQIYWRATAHESRGAIAAISLVASVQTATLDSCPTLSVASRVVVSEALQLAERGAFTAILPWIDGGPREDPDAPHCYLLRLPGRQYSYVEMVHPGVRHTSNWEGWLRGSDYRFELRHELFAGSLEKGVILRGSILGLLVDQRDDQDAVRAHWEAFLRDEVPLTT